MALPKAVGLIVVLLALIYTLQDQGHKQYLKTFFEDLMGEKASHIHTRESEIHTQASPVSSTYDYAIEVEIDTTELEHLRLLLRENSLTLPITNNLSITSIQITTVCSLTEIGYQCRCEENFSWLFYQCVIYGSCDTIVHQTCGCINNLPVDGQYCQLNTIPPGQVEVDLVLELQIPVLQAREVLRSIILPLVINDSLNVTALTLTTVCHPNSIEGLPVCQCEEGFAWPCEKCSMFGDSDFTTTTQTCGCINALPSDGEFCEPVTNPVETEIVLELIISGFSMNFEAFDLEGFILWPREVLRSIILPLVINDFLTVTALTLTTVCHPNSIGGLQCQCEEGFAWPCEKCSMFGVCDFTTTTQTCGCINALPSGEEGRAEFCEPVTNITCPTPTPDMTTTTENMTTTTENMTTTTETATTPTEITPTPQTTSESLSLVIDIPFNEAFADPENDVNINVREAIKRQSGNFISNLVSAELTGFRSGSTIGDYTVRATAFQQNEIDNLKAGLFTDLSAIYTMIFDSGKSLTFPQPFLGEGVTLTCGPPPRALNFSNSWTAKWTRDNEEVVEDSQHSFSRDGRRSTLTVSKFFFTDDGNYECRIRDRGIFRERSNGSLTSREKPLIRVSPKNFKKRCEAGVQVTVNCSVNSPYTVEFKGVTDPSRAITHVFTISADCPPQTFTCQVRNFNNFSENITVSFSNEDFTCIDHPDFGSGNVNDEGVKSCGEDEVGEIRAICKENGTWEVRERNCVLRKINDLLIQSEFLTENSLPAFLEQLSSTILNLSQEVIESPANINATVEILRNVANTTLSLNISIGKSAMEDVLLTAGILTSDGARDSWEILRNEANANVVQLRTTIPEARSPSSSLLLSIETITTNLVTDSFDIVTDFILLNKTTFTDNFNGDFNSSVEIDIPEAGTGRKSLTVITFFSMDNVLPARDEENSTSNVINGRVVLVQSNSNISNVSFAFDISNTTLRNPKCVFWNFSLFSNLGGWDDEGCELIASTDETFTCSCTHLTSFSILMSPFAPNSLTLAIITYIGVGISMASLVICLIIEAVIWRKIRRNNTSYLRHVSIVNIAVSLLIANIWFIIGAAISEAESKNTSACSAATFFIHFFYLALFFWMLASGLLLLYRTVNVFDNGLSKSAMLAIGFTLGYGAPLIIAVITIAVTAPNQQYIQGSGACWLNWEESKALLAFVIPALTIVFINMFILCVVIYKILRRRVVRDSAQANERHVLVDIARSLAVLTPFFGLTWALGVGTVTSPTNEGIHISFAFFNSLQGFFILVFGTLLDKKVRSEIIIRSQTSSGGTRDTSTATLSGGLGFFRRWRRGRDGYNVSAQTSSNN